MYSNNEKKLLLVINGVAGKGRAKSILFKAVELFSQHGYRVTVLPTEPNGITEQKVAQEVGNYSLCTAIGGDGTLNSVVRGIIKSGSNVPLGYIPLGSTNDFAASLKLSKDITEACTRIAENPAREIDIGCFNGEPYVYIACTGMFADASYMTSQQLKNALGYGAYLLKGIKSLLGTRKARYTVIADGERIEGEFLFCAVSNTLRAGGVIWLPKGDVEFDDGYFELTMLKAPATISQGSAMINDLLYSRLDTNSFLRRKAKKIEISVEHPSGWSLDGENGGAHSQAEIDVLEKALRFIY